jgi:GAF domain-containing protein
MSTWARIGKLFAPPVFEGDEEKTRDAALLNILLWVMLGAIVAIAPILIFTSSTIETQLWAFVIVLAFALPIGGLIWMSRWGRVRQASVLLALLIWAATTIAIVVFGGIRSTTTPGYLVAIFMVGLLMGWEAAAAFGLLTAATVFVVLLLEHYGVRIGQYTVPIYPGTDRAAGFDDLFMLLAVVLTTTVIIALTRRNLVNALQRAWQGEHALAEANRELQARGDELQARGHDLERRSRQLQVVAEVSRDVTAVHEVGELLGLAVDLIRERFGFYHVAIFLMDEQGAYAVLKAASGEPGRQMPEGGQQVDLEEEGIVSYVINSGYHRIVLDVGDEAVRFENPLLPETRSEIVLPLRVGRRIIGALDVQSRQEAAFDDDDATILQTLVDQLTVAIENTRLLEQMQRTMRELEVASSRYTQESWRVAVQRGRQGMGYRYGGLGVESVAEPPVEARQAWQDGQPVVATRQPKAAGDGQGAVSALAVPVKLRDQVMGVLNLNFDQAVSPETISLVEEIAGRLALALENARLLDETRQRAQRDRLIADIASQVRASMDVERILQTAVRGLGAALGTDRAFIRLGAAGGAADLRSTAPTEGEQTVAEVGEQAAEETGGKTEEAGEQTAVGGLDAAVDSDRASIRLETAPADDGQAAEEADEPAS